MAIDGYGVVPTGFNRKSLGRILDEIEAALITEFGPDFIQSSESPMGQINGIFANYVATLWELALDIYQSHDVDQAEARRLEVLGKLRLLQRGANEEDSIYRRAITNQDRARIDLQDLARAVKNVDGVTYSQVFLNESNLPDENQLEPGTICIAALGGEDSVIAAEMRRYIVPGISTYGNVYVSTTVDGFCRSIAILRPILVPVTLEIAVRQLRDVFGCPAPSLTVIRDWFVQEASATFINGDDPTHFRIRTIIETQFPNVEVVSFTGERDDIEYINNAPVPIGFIELATFSADNITVVPA